MHPSPIAQASNPHTKPQARKPGSLLKGFANGGTIEGPGTPTSDSIPAKVKQTGEPIQVATGERIVSADQDALLLRIAKAMGHKSVDEMFQAGTGKPVGPTVKYSKGGKAVKAAEGGAVIGNTLEPYVNHRFYQPPPVVPGTAVGPANYQPNFTMGANQTAPVPESPVTDVRAKYNPANGSPEAKAWQASRQPSSPQPAAPTATPPSAPGASSRTTQAFQQFTGVNGGGAGSKVLGAAGKLGAGALNVAGKLALPLAVGNEALQVGQVAMDPNSTGNDVAAQTAQGFGRLGAAGAGAAAGAALGSVVPVVGTAIGGLAGGVLGYMGADKAIEAGRSMLGVDPRAPATRAPPILPSNPAATTPTATNPGAYPEVQSVRNPPAAPPTSPILGNTEGMSVGNGITRFNTPGKSPLFTNMTDAAGLADNANLQARAPMTAQNQGAMDGIQSRQDARMSAMANKEQYDRQVAGAQAVNDAGERLNLEYALKNGKPQERKAAQAILENMDATAKDLRGNAITTRGQDITANASAQSNKLAQNKDGREAAYSAMDQKAKQQLMDAQQEYLNAKTPEEQKAAERKLMTLGNKQGKAPTFHPGSRIKNVDGSETVTPAYVFDPTTGEAREVQPGKSGVPDAATARTQALAALKANPANKAEINKRLAAAGYQPI